MTISFDIYLDNYDQQFITNNFFDKWEEFGFESISIFKIHILFYIKKFTKIEYKDMVNIRDWQHDFRQNVCELYNNKCIISNIECKSELEAAHIKEYKYGGTYSKYNGILLTSNLHKTFDRYLWTINPDTFKIEIKNNHTNGSINKYDGKYIKLPMINELINNLKFRYELFIKKKWICYC